MEKRKKVLLTAAITFGTFFSLVATSVAWFTIIFNVKTGVTASSISNYYGGGDGTENNPYLLKTPKHFYNLSWLQNTGVYTIPTYFKLNNDINMAGSLAGINGTTTGAIPPIGTDAYPFIGEFDGNGKTISNLWVSSDPNDWKERPANFASINIGASIGFFGNIGNIYVNPTTAYVGTAQSFYLENIEVTTKVANSKVGIVAGFTDGNLQSIGVKNAKISLGTTSIPVSSEYSLIGQFGPNVSWENSPNNLVGGDLIIDPNRPGSVFTALTTGTRVVEGSALDTAFYIASLSRITINGGVNSTFFKFNTRVIATTSTTPQIYTATTSNITTVTTTNYQQYVTQDFYDRYYSNPQYTVGVGTIAPTATSTRANITLSTGTVLPVPINSIWFKPINGGLASITFLRQSQAAGVENISVYKFIRSGTTFTNWGEIRFGIDRIGNKAAVYFDFEIPQAMVTAGYEFIVAASPTSPATTSGFLYLSLPGATGSSGVQSSQVYAVDYVYRLASGNFVDLAVMDYVPKRTLIRFIGTFNGTAYYNMKDSPNNDGFVYYAKSTTSNLILQDLVVTNTEGILTTYSVSMFPDRVMTSP